MTQKNPSNLPSSPRTNFAVGDKVRVKPGTTDPDFQDIPLGGWVGTIREVDAETNPPQYLVRWNDHTLKHMHPVCRNRSICEGLDFESMWLSEDSFVPDDGSPVRMEQPTAIHTRPLDMNDQNDRVRAIFGLTSNDPLPEADREALTASHHYLAQHLSFPFPGTYSHEVGPMQARTESITVRSLADADDIDEMSGLFCEARQGNRAIAVPLGEVEVPQKDPNHRLVSDYAYWFWNWR